VSVSPTSITAAASGSGATAADLIGRALRRHCPVCGRGRMFDGWFAQRERCDACGFRFERDEEEDYWLGAYFLNFMATEVLFALLLLMVLLSTWPRPPWTAIIWVGAIQMIATPILSYPLTKALWLAGDLIFRPPTEVDFAQREGSG
jgi:uncharacterized protein (DUF983 family)